MKTIIQNKSLVFIGKVLLSFYEKHDNGAIKTKRGIKVLPWFLFINLLKSLGGKRGIQTPGTASRSPDFESGPIDHSGIFP